MIRIAYFSVFLSFTFTSARSQQLSNTKWTYNSGFKDYKDYYEFIDGKRYKFYSCETGNIFVGNYHIMGDTVIIEQLSGEYDKGFPDNSIHRSPRVKLKLIIIDDQMRPVVRSEFKGGKWLKSDFKFDSNYVFNKEEH